MNGITTKIPSIIVPQHNYYVYLKYSIEASHSALCSIGSLAKDTDEEGVENVRVKTIVFDHSTNGLRIKSWGRPSNAFVRGITYQDILMRNVANPIIIDQNYCPYDKNCPGQVSLNKHPPL